MTSPRTLPALAVLVLAAAGLTACASTSDKAPKNPALAVKTPADLFPLKVEEAKDQIALAIHPEGLSPAQADALRALAGRRAEARGGVVTVSLPDGGADPAAATRMDGAVETALNQLGVPVTRAAYKSDDAKAPVLVSYAYDAADVPECGKHWQDLTKTKDNTVQANFGCAVNANIASMIANPADIRAPRAEGPPDVERRMTVLGKYEAGAVTGAETPKAAPSIAHIGQ